MPAQLKNIVNFVGIATGSTASLPHGLQDQFGRPLVPDSLITSIGNSATLSADAFNVTATNTTSTSLTVAVLCESWHSFERAFGGVQNKKLATQPFVGAQSFPLSGVVSSIAYGDGHNGVAVFNGVNTFPFATLLGSTYTLNKDIFLAGGSSISGGITVNAAGFRGFVNGLFTNNGLLLCSSNNAIGATGGLATATGTYGFGVAGGNGHTGVGAGANGTNVSSSATLQDASATGGAGGQADGSHLGGNGGTYPTTVNNGGASYLIPILTGFLFGLQIPSGQPQVFTIGGGAGGGGGGSNNAGVNGGGGGSGGGVLIWHAAIFINNGTVEALGGNGAAASGTGGDGGGGGGGGGGTILSLASVRSGSGLFLVTGGSGGAGIGAGAAGSPGAIGDANVFLSPV
jgi:hypothetical protein